MSNSLTPGDQAAYQWLKNHKNKEGIRYIDVLFPNKFKSGPKSKPKLTPEVIEQYIKLNNLVGKSKGEVIKLSLNENISGIEYASQRIVKAYRKFLKEGKIENLLSDARIKNKK